VLDLLRAARLACPLIPVTITGGDTPSASGGSYRVPKRDLILGLQIALDSGDLAIASELPETAALLDELAHFRVHISASGHDSYSAPSGAHDDLIIAASLALWRALAAPTPSASPTLSQASTPRSLVRPVPRPHSRPFSSIRGSPSRYPEKSPHVRRSTCGGLKV